MSLANKALHSHPANQDLVDHKDSPDSGNNLRNNLDVQKSYLRHWFDPLCYIAPLVVCFCFFLANIVEYNLKYFDLENCCRLYQLFYTHKSHH